METLQFKMIKTDSQYQEYCLKLENLLNNDINKTNQDEVELLTLLIEKWDHEHNSFQDVTPIELLKSLMNERKLKSKDLVEILGVSKGLVSDILNCKKGLSKEIIRTLASYFGLAQEAFNRPYRIKSPVNSRLRNVSVMNTCKVLDTVP